MKYDPLPLPFRRRIGNRHGRQQRLRVGVPGVAVQLVGRSRFDDASQIHHADGVGNMSHDRQIVRDEDVRQAELLLQVAQQVDHLGLDRNIQGRDRLVAENHLRPHRQSPRDADPLPLAAAELVGLTIQDPRGSKTLSGSPTMRPTLMRGLSEANGS